MSPGKTLRYYWSHKVARTVETLLYELPRRPVMSLGTLISQGFRLCCAVHLGEEYRAASPFCPSTSFKVHNGIQHEVLRLQGFLQTVWSFQ